MSLSYCELAGEPACAAVSILRVSVYSVAASDMNCVLCVEGEVRYGRPLSSKNGRLWSRF